jgi:hypothetical protein
LKTEKREITVASDRYLLAAGRISGFSGDPHFKLTS